MYSSNSGNVSFLPSGEYHGFIGACPRIGISSQIEKLSKNKHSHMCDIASIIF
jgi:hypothetical protein